MAELSVHSQAINSSTAVTKLSGEMDANNFDVLEDEFNKLLESGIAGLVLDLSGLDAASSAGIGAVLNMSHLLAARKGKLVAAAARPKVLGTLEMLGLQEALAMADTAEAAKKMVAALK